MVYRMDTSNALAFTAFVLQFFILASSIFLLKQKVDRAQQNRCRCCGIEDPLLDPS
jgi:hypothetical protein